MQTANPALPPLSSPPAGKEVAESYLRRMTIPLDGSATQLPLPQAIMADEAEHGKFCDFPCVNPLYRTKQHRYVYCLSASRPTNMGNSLAKMDVQDGTCKTWHEAGCAPGTTTLAFEIMIQPSLSSTNS